MNAPRREIGIPFVPDRNSPASVLPEQRQNAFPLAMMISSFATTVLSLGALCFQTTPGGAAPAAQATGDRVPLAGPLIQSQVVLGAGGQVLSRFNGPTSSPAAGLSLCWDNSATPPLAASFQPGDEIVDWGVKSCLKTGVVRSFCIAYRTSALDTNAGGPGAAVTVAFYEDTAGNGVLGRETARYPLTGLPASSAVGVPSNHIVDIDLGDFPFCLADGQIGFGFISDDGVTQTLLTAAPNAALGTQDLLDHYGPGPATQGGFIGSFDLGAGVPFASLYLTLVEDAGTIQASSTVVNGNGVNPLILSEVAPAELGATWLTKVDLSGFPGANFTVLVISSNATLPLPSTFGELLVDLTDPAAIVTVSFGLHALPVPKDTFILGKTFHSQAAVFQSLGAPQLTNGIDVIPGF